MVSQASCSDGAQISSPFQHMAFRFDLLVLRTVSSASMVMPS